MFITGVKLVKFFFIIFLAQVALADVVTEKKRLNKCYALFVRKPIPENHPLWISVSQGTKTGVTACMELISKANLDESGMLINSSDEESKRILRSFSDMSLTFFTNDNITALFTSDVIDSMGAAHFFTRSIFHPTSNFSDVVSLDYALLAKRSGTVERRYSITPKKYSHDKGYGNYLLSFWQGFFPTDLNNPVPPTNFNPLLVETGELIGLIKDESPVIVGAGNHSLGPLFNSAGKNLKQHHGAGAIGTQAYLLSNIDTFHYLTDGAIEIHRTLGKNILADFLCRSAPYLRSSDIVSEINPNSNIDFRKGFSCMGCHAGQDNIAAVTRNFIVIGTNNLWRENRRGIRFVTDPISSKLPTTPLPVQDKNPNFYKESPSGKLFYRNYKGDLINTPLSNLASLGQAIAETEDFYVCTAKKYYRALTGIEVSLADPGNINSIELTEEHLSQKQKVVEFGLRLKDLKNYYEILFHRMNSFILQNKGLGI